MTQIVQEITVRAQVEPQLNCMHCAEDNQREPMGCHRTISVTSDTQLCHCYSEIANLIGSGREAV